MGRSQLSRLGIHRQPALFPKGSADAGWKWQWAGSAAFGSEGPILVTGFFPAVLVLSSITLLEHFHPEEGRTASWFSNLSWGILSLGGPFTNGGNIWMNSWARRSLNILTWKSLFLWVDFFRSLRQSLKWPEQVCVKSWFLNMVDVVKEMEQKYLGVELHI